VIALIFPAASRAFGNDVNRTITHFGLARVCSRRVRCGFRGQLGKRKFSIRLRVHRIIQLFALSIGRRGRFALSFLTQTNVFFSD
jgi:hypothetical protein